MTQYSLGSPPKTSGIYVLKNLATGHAYVGQSVNLFRRWVDWKAVMSTGAGHTNADILAMSRDGDPNDWVFSVLVEIPPDRLEETEQKAIRRTMAALGDKCLNRQPLIVDKNKKTTTLPSNTYGRKSEVTGPDGKPMTIAELARHCGISRDTVKKKLHRMRQKGVTNLTLDEYLARKYVRM